MAKSRTFDKNDMAPVAKRLNIVTQVNTFWTDFRRGSCPFFEILQNEPAPEFKGYWRFQTNLDFEDLTLFMDDKAVRRFLYKMWDIYRVRKIE